MSTEILQSQIDHNETQRILSDAEFIKDGAVMESGRLVLGEAQVERLKDQKPNNVDDDSMFNTEHSVDNEEIDEKEKLIKDIVGITKGTVYGSTTMLREIATNASRQAGINGRQPFRVLGYGGQEMFGDLPEKPGSINKDRAKPFNEKNGDKDYVVFTPFTKAIKETITERVPVVERKMLSSRTVMKDEPRDVIVGYDPISHKSVVGKHGSEEQAVDVKFELNTLDRRDAIGRKAAFQLGFILPIDLARKLRNELRTEPSIVEPLFKAILSDYGFDADQIWTNKVDQANQAI